MECGYVQWWEHEGHNLPCRSHRLSTKKDYDKLIAAFIDLREKKFI